MKETAVGRFLLTTLSLLLAVASYAAESKECVKASSFGFSRENATKCLQAAIDSGAKKVIVDNTGSDWTVEPMHLVSNQEIIFEKDVRLIALKGGFRGRNDSMFRAENKENISIRGDENVVFLMRKKDYQDQSHYERAEWRSGISISGCTNVKISNLTIRSTGGDGVYIGATKEFNCSRSILLEDLVIDDNHRQGISVISAENLTIRRCTIANTGGTPPAFGIDLEPNNGKRECLKNILIEDCRFEKNAGGGIVICPRSAEGITVTVRGCTFTGNPYSFQVNSGNPEGSRIVLKNSKIEDCSGHGIVLRNHNCTYPVSITNVEIVNTKTPILLRAGNTSSRETGNIHFKNVRITAGGNEKPFIFRPEFIAGAYLKDVTGDIELNGRKIDVSMYVTENRMDKNEMFPPARIPELDHLEPIESSKFSKTSQGLAVYGDASYYFQAANPEPVTFYLQPGHSNECVFAPVLTKPDGGKIHLEKFTSKQTLSREYSILPKESGFHRVDIPIDYSAVKLSPGENCRWVITPPENSDGYIKLNFPKGKKVYFLVPQGTRKFHVGLYSDNSGLKASIFGPDGKDHVNIDGINFEKTFTVERDTDKEEVWGIHFKNNCGIVGIRMIEPLLPFIADDPKNLFRKVSAGQKKQMWEKMEFPEVNLELDTVDKN